MCIFSSFVTKLCCFINRRVFFYLIKENSLLKCLYIHMYMFSITDILFGIGGSSVEYMFPTPDPPYQTICLLRETCIFLFVKMFPIPDKTLKAVSYTRHFLYRKMFPIPDKMSNMGGSSVGNMSGIGNMTPIPDKAIVRYGGDWCVPDVRCERTDCTCCKGWSINLVGFSFL